MIKRLGVLSLNGRSSHMDFAFSIPIVTWNVTHGFPSKIFCLTGQKKFVGECFNVSESFGYRKILCIRRGYVYFPLKILCLAVPKKFVEEPLCFKKIGVSKIFMHERGASQYCRKKFCLTGPKRKTWQRKPPVFHKISGI